MLVTAVVTTGVPQACASRIGTPNPSPMLAFDRMSNDWYSSAILLSCHPTMYS